MSRTVYLNNHAIKDRRKGDSATMGIMEYNGEEYKGVS